MCNCTEQCSCGSSVIPTGPQGPMGSQGQAGTNGIVNLYSFSTPTNSGTALFTYTPLGSFLVPSNTLKNFNAGKADALDLTIALSKNFKDNNWFPVLNYIKLDIFGTYIFNIKVINTGDILIKARISLNSTNSVNVVSTVTGYPILLKGFSQGIPVVKNITLTGLNFNVNNPITLETLQSSSDGFTLKSFYIDKITAV